MPSGTSFWAGGSDLAEEGKWMWVNNATFDCEKNFCDWHEGEPNGETRENCLEIIKGQGEWKGAWNDAFCEDSILRYICEKPVVEDSSKEVWIGLNDLMGSQTVSWTDQSPVTFTRWAKGQPYHHAGDNFKCGILNEWNNMKLVECETDRMSVCKRPVEISVVPPNTYGCENGQSEFQGSCYEFMHEYRTFSAAQSVCAEGGGNLLAINNE